MGRLADRTALITGASRGIGRAIAERYAAEGANVFLTATNLEKLEETRASVFSQGAQGVEAHCHVADISDPSSVEAMFEAALAWRGGVDILVNNAGIHIQKPVLDYALEDLDRIMKVNVHAVFQLTQLAIRHMLTRGAGKIVNIASTAGKWESPNQAIYNMSKHAVVGLTRCAALEFADKGININAVCPGIVEGGMFDLEKLAASYGATKEQVQKAVVSRVPMGRLVTLEEVAHLAVYLGSQESNGMTGQTITISGGMRMG